MGAPASSFGPGRRYREVERLAQGECQLGEEAALISIDLENEVCISEAD
jgi:hypothetical protein